MSNDDLSTDDTENISFLRTDFVDRNCVFESIEVYSDHRDNLGLPNGYGISDYMPIYNKEYVSVDGVLSHRTQEMLDVIKLAFSTVPIRDFGDFSPDHMIDQQRLKIYAYSNGHVFEIGEFRSQVHRATCVSVMGRHWYGFYRLIQDYTHLHVAVENLLMNRIVHFSGRVDSTFVPQSGDVDAFITHQWDCKIHALCPEIAAIDTVHWRAIYKGKVIKEKRQANLMYIERNVIKTHPDVVSIKDQMNDLSDILSFNTSGPRRNFTMEFRLISTNADIETTIAVFTKHFQTYDLNTSMHYGIEEVHAVRVLSSFQNQNGEIEEVKESEELASEVNTPSIHQIPKFARKPLKPKINLNRIVTPPGVQLHPFELESEDSGKEFSVPKLWASLRNSSAEKEREEDSKRINWFAFLSVFIMICCERINSFVWRTLKGGVMWVFNWTTLIVWAGFRLCFPSSFVYAAKRLMQMDFADLIFEFQNMEDDFRLRLVEVKALLHTVWYLMYDMPGHASGHSGYLMLTRPIGLVNVGTNLLVAGWSCKNLLKNSFVTVEGKEYAVDSVELERLCKLSDQGEKIDPNSIITLMESQAGALEMISSNLGSLIAKYKIGNMSVKDIELANKQYAFIHNTQTELNQQTALMSAILRMGSRTVFIFDPLDPAYQNYACDLIDTGVEVNNMKFRETDIPGNKALMTQVIELYKRCEKLNNSVRMGSVAGYLQRSYSLTFRSATELAIKATQCLHGARQRAEPVSVFFMGPPGVGKSPCVEAMKTCICAIDGINYSPEMSYLIGPSKFWAKYANQKFVIFDDVFKVKDKPALITDSTKFIEMINTNPYNLDMPDVESKGIVYFDSEYVFSTTNYGVDNTFEGTTWEIGLKDPAAFTKRCHLVIERFEKSGLDVYDNLYTVAKCDAFPQYEGKQFKPPQLAAIAKQMRMERDARLISQKRGPAAVAEMLDQYGIPRQGGPIEGNILDFEIQNGPETERKPPDAVEWLIKIIPLQICDWSSSPWFKWYMLAFAMLVTLITIPMLLAKVVPEFETHDSSPGSSTASQSTKTTNYSARKISVTRKKGPDYDTAGHGYSTVPVHQFEKHDKVVKFEDEEEFEELESHSAEVNFYLTLRNKIVKGVAYLEFWFENQVAKRTFSVAFHIKDRLMMVPAHSIMPYDEVGKVAKMMVHINGVDHFIDFPIVNRIEDEDAAFFKLPKSIPMPLALYGYLAEAGQSKGLSETQEIYQVGIDPTREVIIRRLMKIPYTGIVKYECAGETLLMYDAISYIGVFRKGHSGCPAIIETEKGAVIVGMHVGAAGKEKTIGMAVIMCKEWIDSIFQDMEVQSARVLVEPDYLVLPHLAHQVPRRTRIKPSKICGWKGVPSCVPVRFTPFEKDGIVIDPLALAMSNLKQQHFQLSVPYDGTRALEYLMTKYPKKVGARVLTFEEALNGSIPDKMPSIVGSTSPGYPYSLHSKKGKAPFVTQVNNKYVFQPEFLADLKEMEQKLIKGENIEVIWADTLKDETKEREKVEKGKVRLFASCPLHFLILGRMYLLDFITELMKSPDTGPIAMGLNVHGYQWTVLCKRINRFRKSIIAGDFSAYDSSLIEPVGQTVLQFANWWYGDDEVGSRVRTLLFQHFWNSVRICEDVVYSTKGSMPTGQFFTAGFNSVYNIIINHIVLTQDLGLLESEFELSVYGDDNIIGVNREDLRCSDLTPHFLRRFGMKYTHFSKSDVDPVDNISTVRYLGRRFDLQESKYFAPRELRDVIESTYWTRGKDKQHIAFASNVMSCFLELSHFNIATYRQYTDEILTVIKNTRGLESTYDYLVRTRKTWYEFHDMKYDETKSKMVDFYSRGNTNRWIDFAEIETPNGHRLEFETQSGSMEGVSVSDNVDFTERASNAVQPTQDVQLGTYQDVAPTSLGAMDKATLLDPQRTCNMEVFTLDDVIQREFSLAPISWLVSDSANTLKATYSFPDVLFAQPFIQEKIKDFRMFRGAIRITFRCVANKFLYGKLIVSFWPILNAARFPSATVKFNSSIPHVLVSASSGDTVVFDVPFVYNKRALDLADYTPNAMGNIYVRVMNPLIDVMGESSDAQIFVTAQFRDAELFLPHDAGSSVLAQKISKRYIDAEFETHSGSLHKAPTKKISKSLVMKGAEARKKSTAGTISQIAALKGVMDSGLESAKFFASYVSGAVETIAPFAAMIGLSKPKTTDALTMMKINPFCDINTGTGVDFTTTLGMDPENAISTMPNVAGCTNDEMDLKQFCGTPVLSRQWTFTKGNSTPQLLASPNFQAKDMTEDTADYTDWMCNMFNYVSGSRKVKIYICASLYHSARFVIYLSDNTVSAVWQNCYHVVVDVQGDTEVEFTLPYCSNKLCLDTLGDVNQMALVAFPLSWSQPDNVVSAPIYFNVYTAAASDIEFGGLMENVFEVQSCPRADFAKTFPPFHPSVESYSPVNLVHGESYTTIRQIIHKYQAINAFQGTGPNIQIPAYSGGGNIVLGRWIGLEMFGQAFHFWRGSTRFKIITPGLNPTALFVTRGTRVFVGTAISSSVNQLQEIEIPFYQQVFYLDTADYSDILLNMTGTYPSSYPLIYEFSAAGDDFSFHFQCMPRTDARFIGPQGGTGFQGLKILDPYPPSS